MEKEIQKVRTKKIVVVAALEMKEITTASESSRITGDIGTTKRIEEGVGHEIEQAVIGMAESVKSGTKKPHVIFLKNGKPMTTREQRSVRKQIKAIDNESKDARTENKKVKKVSLQKEENQKIEAEKLKWQIKDDEWARRYDLAFSKTEKTTSEIDTSKTELKEKEEVKQKTEEKVKDLITDINVSKHVGSNVLPGTLRKERLDRIEAEMETEKKVAEKSNKEYSKSTIRPENTVAILEKINKQREEGKFTKTVDQKATETVKAETNTAKSETSTTKASVSTSTSEQKTENRSEKLEPWEEEMVRNGTLEPNRGDLLARMERKGQLIDHSKDAKVEVKTAVNEGAEKVEPVNAEQKPALVEPKAQAPEGLKLPPVKTTEQKQAEAAVEREEKMKADLNTKVKAEAEAQKAEENNKKYAENIKEDARQEEAIKIAAGIARARGIQEGKDALWAEIKRPRGIKEKFEILFSRHGEPKTDEEMVAQYKRDIYRTVVLAGVGGALIALGVAGTLQYLGVIPIWIKNLVIRTKDLNIH